MKIKCFALWVVFWMMAFGLPASAREWVGATFSADGKTAYHAVKPGYYHLSVYLYVTDLSEKKTPAFHEIPAGAFRRAYLFNQGPHTLLVVPQKLEADRRLTCRVHVYLCKPNGPPELLGGDDFFIHPSTKPHMWQNIATLIGKNASGAHALMYIQNGETAVVPIQDPANVKGIHYGTSGWMGYVEVRFPGRTLHFSPFLTSTGRPLVVQTKHSIGSPTLLRFAKEYYGDNKKLEMEKQEDGAAKLFAASFLNARSLSAATQTPLASQPLYRARVFNQDREIQWVLGDSDTEPQKASVIGYVYDRQNERLTKLPSLDNVDWRRVHSIISFSPRHLILEMGNIAKNDVLMFHLDKGTSLYASALDFSDKPAPQPAGDAADKPESQLAGGTADKPKPEPQPDGDTADKPEPQPDGDAADKPKPEPQLAGDTADKPE
ncbi:MAG: hypothetical protein FWC28_06335, partial [Proteobacteria bacterium]|nr:hypothetical protein [Pseudomonadota bacterium]